MRILKTVALAGVAVAALWSGAAQALTFERVGNTLAVSGEFEFGDYGVFEAELAKGVPTTIVLKDSPGGAFADALRIGADIRARGIKTIADGDCFSACAFVWLAGTERGLTESAKVGFHAPRNADTGKMSASGTAIAGKYMGEMGCSDLFIIGVLDGGLKITYLTVRHAKELKEVADFEVTPIRTQAELEQFLGR